VQVAGANGEGSSMDRVWQYEVASVGLSGSSPFFRRVVIVGNHVHIVGLINALLVEFESMVTFAH